MTAKNIVLCADGTGNVTVKGRGSNVFKLFEAVDIHGHRDDRDDPVKPQVAFYHDGVGTAGGKFRRLVSGAFGTGLAENVKDLYLDLVRVYRPGDSIYLFGFSRGAFTVRTLAGFIHHCGVMRMDETTGDDADLRARTDAAYRAYVASDPAVLQRYTWVGMSARQQVKVEEQSREFAHYPVPIEFIGVWDTVAGLGFPVEEIANWWNHYINRFKFRNNDLTANVGCARHAIAIDDARTTFQPTLWNEQEGVDAVQVWFAGVHSNVGGGYVKHGMSLVTLNWMMTEAEKCGLRLIAPVRELYGAAQNVHDQLYDSREGFRCYYRYSPRDVAKICERFGAKPRIHESVMERVRFGTEGYAPGNLPRDFVLVPYDAGSLPTPASSQLRERWRSSRHAGRLLEKARAWVFRRKFLYWGMFAATGGIVAELIIDIWRATDGAGARTLSAIWNEKPDWSGDDLVERLVDVVPALYAWAGVSIRQGGELAVRAVRSEAALLVVPEVLASTLGFILVAVICYGLSVDARARMARLFARSWFTILQSTGTSPRGRAIGGDALGSEQATRAGGAGQETNGREGSLQ